MSDPAITSTQTQGAGGTDVVVPELKRVKIGVRPFLQPANLAVVVWIEVQGPRLGFPMFEVGEGEHSIDIILETPWIETVQGLAITLPQIKDEIINNLQQQAQFPLFEREEIVTLIGAHEIEFNAAVKDLVIDCKEGGDSIETVLSGNALGLIAGQGLVRGDIDTTVIWKK